MIVSLPMCVNVKAIIHWLIMVSLIVLLSTTYHHKPPGKDRITWPRPSHASNSAAPAASRCWSKGRLRAGALWWGLGRQRPGSVAGDGAFFNHGFWWFFMIFDGFWCFFYGFLMFLMFFFNGFWWLFNGFWWLLMFFLWFLMLLMFFLLFFYCF